MISDTNSVTVQGPKAELRICRHALRQNLVTNFGKNFHQLLIMKMEVLDDVADLSVPFITHIWVQLNSVYEPRHLVCHESD